MHHFLFGLYTSPYFKKPCMIPDIKCHKKMSKQNYTLVLIV